MKRNPTPAVIVYRVGIPQDVPLSIGGGGIIYPQQQVAISYPLVGRAVSMKVKAGEHVSLHQPLIQLDLERLAIALKQAAANVAAAQGYLASITGQRNTVIQARAQQSYDHAKNSYNALVAQMSSPLFEHGTLLSPMDGIVTTVSINPNEVFMPNSSLLTIADVSTVLVHARVPLNYFGQLHLKQRATVTPSAPSASAIEGTITNIIAQNDPESDTFEVWVSVPNHTMALLPGMSALVSVQTTIRGMIVPRLSVLSPEATASVIVVRDQIVHLQQVQVLGRGVTSIYITGNIFPGEQIVLVGLDTLRDGQRVRITEGNATLF